jgi:hypothetical protein
MDRLLGKYSRVCPACGDVQNGDGAGHVSHPYCCFSICATAGAAGSRLTASLLRLPRRSGISVAGNAVWNRRSQHLAPSAVDEVASDDGSSGLYTLCCSSNAAAPQDETEGSHEDDGSEQNW